MGKKNHGSPAFSLLRAAAILLACSVSPAFAEPDKDDPAAELASFKLPPGFQANLFASEKDGVVKPIQIRWDTRGRLWVIQSTTYPQLVPGEVPNDKVLILEDTTGAGKADKVTVFADGLMIPTGLEIANTGYRIPDTGKEEGNTGKRIPDTGKNPDGASQGNLSGIRYPVSGISPSACYVGEGTKLLLLTDTDGDDKCDRREVVLRGFGTGDNHQNINSFRWSPGGELFFSQGLHAHARVETAYGIVPLDEAGFWRYRPREGRLDSFYGGPAEPQNPWGFVWTDWGQPLMCAGNNGGIYWPLPEMIRGYRYGRRDQIWENARGRKSSGPDIVGTAHLPPEWQGVMLTGGYINNAVWALKIEDDGAGFKISDFRFQISDVGKTPDAGVQSEIKNLKSEIPPGYFVQSTHPSFRPVDVKVGPDGAIYLCDWYNPIIGHYQASFRHPDRDKTHGRIWRITYKDRPLVKPPKIAGAKLEELFENLKSGERWVREMTRLELMGRKTEEVVKELHWWCERLSPEDGATDHAVYEALGIFESHESPDTHALMLATNSKNPDLRAYALGTRTRWAGRPKLVPPGETLAWFAADLNPRVRVAAAVGAGNIPDKVSPIVVLTAASEPTDKFIELALRSAVKTLHPQIEAALAETHGFWPSSWEDRLKALRSDAPLPPPQSQALTQLTRAIEPTGKLRATPEFVAALVQEVRESGDAKHGGEVFRRADIACTACHSIADQGGKIGPPLDTIGSGQPVDFIIGATLEPQREIKESYEALQLTAKDGRTALGYLAARDPQQTTIRDPATGTETKFATGDIAESKMLGSFMPAALVDNLTREDLRDLFRYLSELGKPKP